jgi:AcrR family transcriptional regulator
VSRGALYHHFAGKDALFQAVVQALEARIARADDPGAALVQGRAALAELIRRVTTP